VLMLAPTRELASQTHEVTLGIGARILAPLLDGANSTGTITAEPVALLSSSTRVQDNAALLARTPTLGNALVAVGTPGRVLQLLERGMLRPEHLRALVIDEADELFSQGFQAQLAGICAFLPRDIQIVLVSATLPDDVRALAARFMRNPTRILLEPRDVPIDAIRQFRVDALDSADAKMAVLFDLYERISIAQSIIFVNSRRRAECVAREMNAQRFAVALTHGDLSRAEREAVMERFRRGDARVLVTTDLVGRGIDVVQVNLVINFELPLVLEKYIHRVGRCGRFGKKGIAVNLISRADDLPIMKEIEKQFGITTTEFPMDFEKYLS
jgi:translation initiation factor 4A